MAGYTSLLWQFCPVAWSGAYLGFSELPLWHCAMVEQVRVALGCKGSALLGPGWGARFVTSGFPNRTVPDRREVSAGCFLVRTAAQLWGLGWERDAGGPLACTHSGVLESRILESWVPARK